MLTLYDADRCPYCARVRIVLAEKRVEYETMQIDLANRPTSLFEKNPLGKVPVLEEGTFVLPESAVIMEYLDERYPEPPLYPADPGARALARLWIERFDDLLGDDYYAVRRGGEGARERLEARLRALDGALDAQPYLGGADYSLADIAYVPWFLRAQALLGVELSALRAVRRWLDRLAERPAVAAELDVVAALPR